MSNDFLTNLLASFVYDLLKALLPAHRGTTKSHNSPRKSMTGVPSSPASARHRPSASQATWPAASYSLFLTPPLPPP